MANSYQWHQKPWYPGGCVTGTPNAPGWYGAGGNVIQSSYVNPSTGKPWTPAELGGAVGADVMPEPGASTPQGTFWNPLHSGSWNVPANPAASAQAAVAAAGGGAPATPPVSNVADMSPFFEAGEQLTAPMSTYEQQALEMLSTLAGQLGGMGSPYETPMGQNVGAALTQLLSGEFPEEYFQTSIAGPTRKTFEELTAPAIREEFVEPGMFWGTERMQEVSGKRSDVEETLAAIRGDLGYKAQQMALQSLGPGMQYMGLPLEQMLGQMGGLSSFMGAGALPRLIEQHGLDIAYQEFIRTRPENQPYAQMLMSLLGIPMMASYAPESPESPLAPMAQIFGSLIPLLMG